LSAARTTAAREPPGTIPPAETPAAIGAAATGAAVTAAATGVVAVATGAAEEGTGEAAATVEVGSLTLTESCFEKSLLRVDPQVLEQGPQPVAQQDHRGSISN
jgi:hypothetical protein